MKKWLFNREKQIRGDREKKSAATVKKNPRVPRKQKRGRIPETKYRKNDSSGRLQTELEEDLQRQLGGPVTLSDAGVPGFCHPTFQGINFREIRGFEGGDISSARRCKPARTYVFAIPLRFLIASY